MHVEDGFQNHATKINRRARGVACAQTILREKRAVLARDAPTIREQRFTRVRVFDERDDAREQALPDLALMLALLGIRRESGVKPGRVGWRMRVHFIAHRPDGLLNWGRGNFRFALAEKRIEVGSGKPAMSAGRAITRQNSGVRPFAQCSDVDTEQATGIMDRKPIARNFLRQQNTLRGSACRRGDCCKYR